MELGRIEDARHATSVRREYRRIAAVLEGFAAEMEDFERTLRPQGDEGGPMGAD